MTKPAFVYAITCTQCGEQVEAPQHADTDRRQTLTTACRCNTSWVFVYNDRRKCVGYHRVNV